MKYRLAPLAIAHFAVAMSSLAVSVHAGSDEHKPNVLVFLCDDTGYGEFGFQGANDIPTPHIDSIAAGGVRFTQGYVSGTYCSPTRAGLMTGRYQTRFGHEFNSTARVSGLSLEETTFADRFQSLGYATCAVGKWHLGQKPEYHPLKRGFDEFFGTLTNTPFFHPTQLVDSRVSPAVEEISDDSFYTTDAYAERCVDWLEKNKDKPWFLYVPFNAQHAPLQAPQKYLDRFPEVKDDKRQLFCAMMSAMDDAVGRVLAKVRDLGQEENTLIFFLSDNGGPTGVTTSRNGPLRGFKATTWEGGVRVPFCMQWKGKVPAGQTYENPVIQLDILPTALAATGLAVDPTSPKPLDGVNLLPYLTGENKDRPHQTLYWRFTPQWAIRDGDWKLVQGRDGGPQPGLFNLADDIGEKHDLAATHPDKVKELKAKWDAWNAEQAEASVPNDAGRRRNNNAPPGRPNQQSRQRQPGSAG
ncbi:MAG: sulfatase-like hydrolase/transferase [Pirellulales bacterium]|nr:sulfatase-like hydrolase/transferase [Pirellulales bacterium]